MWRGDPQALKSLGYHDDLTVSKSGKTLRRSWAAKRIKKGRTNYCFYLTNTEVEEVAERQKGCRGWATFYDPSLTQR